MLHSLVYKKAKLNGYVPKDTYKFLIKYYIIQSFILIVYNSYNLNIPYAIALIAYIIMLFVIVTSQTSIEQHS